MSTLKHKCVNWFGSTLIWDDILCTPHSTKFSRNPLVTSAVKRNDWYSLHSVGATQACTTAPSVNSAGSGAPATTEMDAKRCFKLWICSSLADGRCAQERGATNSEARRTRRRTRQRANERRGKQNWDVRRERVYEGKWIILILLQKLFSLRPKFCSPHNFLL